MAEAENPQTVQAKQPIQINTNIPSTKQYELDWTKIKTFTDVILLLKLITGSTDKKCFLFLQDSQMELYKHLLKEEEKEEKNGKE